MEDTSARPVKKLSRRWRIARTALGIAIAVLLAEAALRLVWTPPSVLSTQPVERHDLYSIGNIPGIRGRTVSMEFDIEFTHSAQGLRQRNVIGPEPPEGMTRRLLFLGDSFTYGHGVADDEAFVSRVAAALPGVEVANLGCSGHNTRCQLAVLDHFGAVFEPDLTVVVFFWNDLEENLERKRPAFSVREGRLVRADGKDPYAWDPLALRAPGKARSTVSAWSVPYLARLFKEAMRAARYRWLGMSRRFMQTEEQRARAWEETRDCLDMMKLRAAQIGTRLLIVCVPDHNQVDPAAKIVHIDPFHFDVEERLEKECAALGVEFVDLLPGMLEHFERATTPLYYYADRHLTPEGNRLFAELLLPHVRAALDAAPAKRG